MNLVGKILTGLIALFSIVFMALVLAVYATHTNWREEAKKLEKSLQQLRTEKDALEAKRKELELASAAEIKFLQDHLGSARKWRETLEAENKKQADELKNLEMKLDTAQNALKATQDNMNDLYVQIYGDGKGKIGLRQQVLDEQQKRDAEFQKSVALQDQADQLASFLSTLRARIFTLSQDLQKYRDILNLLKLPHEPEAYAGTPPAEVAGRVTDVTPSGLVEVNIGEDDGLRAGHQLHVYRLTPSTTSYLGRIEVIRTQPERAVCKVLRDFQKGPIQRDDRVTSKF
ncbi:MAG: hypothetical protein ACUVUC_12440 [Thermoguttaceae bacterium]